MSMLREYWKFISNYIKDNKNYLLCFLGLLSLFIWFILPIKYLIHFTSDDSYFYLKTAWNFSKGLGSSFDGINLTNGYHPLLFLVLSLFYFLTNSIMNLNSENLLRFTFFITSIINLISIFFINKVFRELNFERSNLTSLIFYLLVIPFTLLYLFGVEIQLMIMIYLALVYITIYKKFNDSKLNFIIGILLGLLFLVRIDLGLLLAIIFVLIRLNKYNQKQILFVVFPFFVIIISYLIINKIYFDTYSSISSYYKFSLDIKNNLRFFPTPLSNPIDFSMLVIFLASGLVYLLYKINSKQISNHLIKIFELSYIIAFLFLLIQYFLNRQGVREWYYTFPIFIAFTLLTIVIDRKKLHKLFLLPSIFVFVLYFTLFRMNYYNHDSAYEFSKKVQELVKENEIIFQIDYSGLISFFSERIIVNGDGLINSFNYYKTLKQGKLFDYLDYLKPQYFIFYSFQKDDEKAQYEFQSFHRYLFEFNRDRILLKYPFIYGGIFRKKYGHFYLIKFKQNN